MPNENSIRIGMTAPLTGPASESGIALKEGATLAVEEVNAAGGVELGGQKVRTELLVEDCKSEPEVGVAAAEKLIAGDKVHYLVGDALHSSVTMAIMDLAPKYGIPIVSGEPVSQAIVEKVVANPEKYRYYWKMDFGSSAYGHAVFELVSWLMETGAFHTSTRTIGFVIEDTDYGRSNAEAAAKRFEAIGWSAVAAEVVPLAQAGFGAQLGKLAEAKVDVLVSVFTAVAAGAALVRQFHETGADALHVAVYYPNEPDFLERAGSGAEGLLWAPLEFDPRHGPAQQAFANQVRENLQLAATFDHAFGYDAVQNAVDSISRAGSLKPDEIVAAVAALDRQGIAGRYVFDASTHQIKAGPAFIPVPVAQIQAGESLTVWPERFAAGEYQPQPWAK